MTQQFDQAAAFISALAGDPLQAIMDWRALSDREAGAEGHARRGTLYEHWEWLCAMNNQAYGIFCTIAMMDGQGRKLPNVQYIRAHYVDLDNLSSQQNYERAAAHTPAPSFAVHTSTIYKDDGSEAYRKHHIYWPAVPYADNQRFEMMQRRMRQFFDGDKAVIDATRVMRVPGFYHCKGDPHLVTCHALAGYGTVQPIEALEAAFAHVNVIDGGGGRHELGEPGLAAPSLDWLRHALKLTDPADLDRPEWLGISAAIKQAGWTLTDPLTLRHIWDEWCARFPGNDLAENEKLWASIRNSELGWPSLTRRIPSLRAALSFGGQTVVAPTPVPVPAPVTGAVTPPMPEPPALDCSGEYLTHLECAVWFAGCTFVVKLGQILVPDGRFLNANQFNGNYGGKYFIIDGNGKKVNEPWQAATRSTLWTVPKVDHVRFLPSKPHGEIVTDDLGRRGVNTYKPAVVKRVTGDVTPFLAHLAALLPDPNDQTILISWLAHNVRYPGYKIPWAPVIQSVEGAGKGVFKQLMTHALGKPYVHFPNAKELTNSGSQFNAWMRNKLFILADEIKVDDKRDLIEVLKPMISEVLIEVQSKGVDQELEDNYANWLFFTNYKNAVPISKNGRRYAVFYSPLQTEQDLAARGMDDAYFSRLYSWLNADGAAIITDWLHNYPLERGAIPHRAPRTSSWDEAVKIGRSPIERVIQEAIEQGLPGFRGGWVSSVSAVKRIRDTNAARGNVPPHVITEVLEGLGYIASGRALRVFFQENGAESMLADLYHVGGAGDVAGFGREQGWE